MNDYKPGDRITLEHEDGSRLVEREVTGITAVYGITTVETVADEELAITELLDSGWRITSHVAKADLLPTDPGYYRSAKPGDWIFRLDDEGHWTLLNTNSLFPVRDGHLQGHLPFTRLVPEQ